MKPHSINRITMTQEKNKQKNKNKKEEEGKQKKRTEMILEFLRENYDLF